jgi:hypothetical protein
MTPEEIEYFKQLSEENKSTQKMLSEVRNMLFQFLKDRKNESARRRDRCW